MIWFDFKVHWAINSSISLHKASREQKLLLEKTGKLKLPARRRVAFALDDNNTENSKNAINSTKLSALYATCVAHRMNTKRIIVFLYLFSLYSLHITFFMFVLLSYTLSVFSQHKSSQDAKWRNGGKRKCKFNKSSRMVSVTAGNETIY